MKEKRVTNIYRLDDLDSRLASSSDTRVKKSGFGIEKLNHGSHASTATSRSFKRGMINGSEGLKSIGRSLGFGVSKAVFPEDLKVSEKKIFDPQDKFLLLLNKLFVVSCILAVSIDPLFFYLPVIDDPSNCLGIDRKMAIIVTTLRTAVDVFYLIHMALQFCTAYIAPSSRVFGRGELVIDSTQIAKRYMRRYFIVDFLSVLPIPQEEGTRQNTYRAMEEWFFRMVPLTSELKRTAETAWAGAAYYLMLYMLASHIVGAFWYLLAVERNDSCWQEACTKGCKKDFLYCGNWFMEGYNDWNKTSDQILKAHCSTEDDSSFDFGIFEQALSSGIISSKKFVSKYCYCLWWGLQNLSWYFKLRLGQCA